MSHRTPWYAAITRQQQKNQLARTFRVPARLHAVAVLNKDSASDEQRKEQLPSPQNPAELHLWWRGRSMCRFESRLFCCPGAGCGIQTSPHPPGSADPTAERHPGSGTHGLWEVGWGREGEEEGVRDRESAHKYTVREAESAHAGRGLTRQRTQASSVTKVTVKVIDFILADKSTHSVIIGCDSNVCSK